MNTYRVVFTLFFLVHAAHSWRQTLGGLSAAVRYEQFNNPNYLKNYVNHVIFYAQQQQQQQQHQNEQRQTPWRPNYFSNRVRELDEDRIVFTNDSHFHNPASNLPKNNDLGNSLARPTIASNTPLLPSTTSREEKIEQTTSPAAPTTPATQDSTEDQSVNAITSRPSRCLWAIISCCSPQSNRVRHECFELLGCQGAFWDNNPCDGQITQSAAKVALDFYSKG